MSGGFVLVISRRYDATAWSGTGKHFCQLRLDLLHLGVDLFDDGRVFTSAMIVEKCRSRPFCQPEKITEIRFSVVCDKALRPLAVVSQFVNCTPELQQPGFLVPVIFHRGLLRTTSRQQKQSDRQRAVSR